MRWDAVTDDTSTHDERNNYAILKKIKTRGDMKTWRSQRIHIFSQLCPDRSCVCCNKTCVMESNILSWELFLLAVSIIIIGKILNTQTSERRVELRRTTFLIANLLHFGTVPHDHLLIVANSKLTACSLSIQPILHNDINILHTEPDFFNANDFVCGMITPIHLCSPWLSFKFGQAQQISADTVPHSVLF